jgi:hypothetical protein
MEQETELQTFLRINTKVKPGGRIEIRDPKLPPGENVEVIVLFQEKLEQDR